MDITLLSSGSEKGFSLYALIVDETCQVIEYIESLEQKYQKQIISLFNLITETGLPHNEEKYRGLGDNINELKTRGGVRILCFSGGPGLPRSLILTHGFQKPHRKILVRQKNKALKWRKQFIQEPVNLIDLKT